MAKKKKKEFKTKAGSKDTIEEISKELIKEINSEVGDKIAYTLGEEDSPTDIKDFISTGSKLLDYAIANKKNGGVPVGRITEILGEESTGKSLLALEILKNTQKRGGIGILLDTESATSPELLEMLGVDLKSFIYAQPDHIEGVFDTIEKIIKKMHLSGKDRPVTIVWDSVAGTPTKAELEGEADDQFMAVAAKVIAQNLRRITQLVGSEKTTIVFTNQLKTKLGVLFGDGLIGYGGKSIPYHSSVRIKLTRDGKVTGEKGKDDVIGVGVRGKCIKNKVAIPFQTAAFSILFNIGVEEGEQILDKLVAADSLRYAINDKMCDIKFKAAAWSTMIAIDEDGNEVIKESFRKSAFADKVVTKYEPMIADLLDFVCVRKLGNAAEMDIDVNSTVEVEALAQDILEG